ncbi:hypothetical protein BKA61DRAFT_551291 [Leptodontidium sp. MPI-SDFR-AT-0119]|nr:hypothetical protein BKA61DRAFT_551291 [Leptodontidium sp. MPI-SDFR-AT-0119]
MPPLSGFSDNSFKSRDDVLLAATSLLAALEPYKSPCGARIKLSTATGTGFDETSAQLEGFARPLWVVADLLALLHTTSSGVHGAGNLDLESWVRGLEAGVDHESDSFWGVLGDCDQRMVEMEPIAYALLTAPAVFFPSEVDKQQKLIAWLRSINDKEVPPSNWRWFRVLVNLALVKACGVPYDEVKPIMESDLAMLDSFYLADGWSSDGLWSTDKKQADYYSGSFAIQYAQLAYMRFARDLDPERVERYAIEASEFAQTFWRYFDVNGAAIPFGRSLTYRFAFAAFWSAAVTAEVPLPGPVKELGVVKGLILRHLRWWAKKTDIFNTDGTLNIGYAYPNMYMSEDYNSPQSVYWSFKTFSILALFAQHLFWTCEELPHPLAIREVSITRDGVTSGNDKVTMPPTRIAVVAPAVQIICSQIEHHFLLSAGQFTKKTHKAREAKYSKFAYSSAFAFSVPTGPLLPQLAPDSTLSVSDDDGETWRVRGEPLGARVQTVNLSFDTNDTCQKTSLPTLVSAWRPWRTSSLWIETTLVSPLDRWPGWHVRIHKVTGNTQQSIQCVDAGFAISSQSSNGGNLPQLNSELGLNTNSEDEGKDDIAEEGYWQGGADCLVLSDAGASGICDFTDRIEQMMPGCRLTGTLSKASILKPDANTNLIAQRTLIPTIHHEPRKTDSSMDHEDIKAEKESWFATGVFAVAASAGLSLVDVRRMWQDRPSFRIER